MSEQAWELRHVRVWTFTAEQHAKAEAIYQQTVSLFRANGLKVEAVWYPVSGHRRTAEHGLLESQS